MAESDEIQEIEHEVEEEISNEKPEYVIKANRVCDLTQKDKDYLLECARNGIQNDKFDVKLFKNGNHKIVLHKTEKKSVAQKTIETKRDRLTNDQLLMEHVIDLESRFKVMEMKHKKLKRKYKNLKQDLYIDADEEETTAPAPAPVDDVKEKNAKDKKEVEVKKEPETFEEKLRVAKEEVQASPPAYMKQQVLRGWRSRVNMR